MRRILLSLTIVAGFFLIATSAQADVMSGANIYWDTFNVQLIDLSNGQNVPTFNWTLEYGQVSSNAQTHFPYESQWDSADALDFTTSIGTSTSTSRAQSSSLRDASVLSAGAATQLSSGAPTVGWNFAEAYSGNSGTFEMTGYGIALITVDWSIDYTGAMNDLNDYSYASVSIAGSYSDGSFNNGNASGGTWGYSPTTGSGTQSGTFSMAVVSQGSSLVTGDFYAEAYAQANSQAVPEPASCVLMGLGLGLVGWTYYRRRRS